MGAGIPAMRRLLPTILFLLLAAGARGDAPRITITVEPRLELLLCAMTQSEWPQPHAGFFAQYARDAQQQFFAERRHPAVQTLNALRRQGAPFDSLVRWALLDGQPDAALVSAAGGRETLERLDTELKSFAAAAHFDDFMAKERPLLDGLVEQVRAGLPGDDTVDRLEKFYGRKRAGYAVVLAPLLAHVRVHDISHTSDGERDTLVLAPDSYDNGRLVFDPTALRDLVCLGFGKPLAAEDLLTLPPATIGRHAGWFAYVAPAMRKAGIHSWAAMLAETITRAAAIRMWQAAGSERDAARLQRQSMAEGFALLPFVQESLAVYDADRARFPTLRAYMPRLLAALDQVEPILSGTGEPKDLGLADVWLTDAGVPVKGVTPRSLAAEAGIRPGDTIQSIAGIRINGSESYLKAWHAWEASPNGAPVPFRVLRGGKPRTQTVIMRRNVTFHGFRKKGA